MCSNWNHSFLQSLKSYVLVWLHLFWCVHLWNIEMLFKHSKLHQLDSLKWVKITLPPQDLFVIFSHYKQWQWTSNKSLILFHLKPQLFYWELANLNSLIELMFQCIIYCFMYKKKVSLKKKDKFALYCSVEVESRNIIYMTGHMFNIKQFVLLLLFVCS